MEFEIQIVQGPSTQSFTKEAAVEKLQSLPGFPENASYTIEEIDGRYVAAVVVPKTAGPFPPAADDSASEEPPADDFGASDEESGPPKSEGEAKKEDKGEGDSSDGAPKSEKAGVEHMLANLTDMLTKITDALGLSTPADGMVPGADDPMAGPPGPPGVPGQHPGAGDGEAKPGEGADGKMHTVHERSLKPGEAPPGTTPVGAPAFASVQVEDDHPWKSAIEAGVKEIEVESEIGDTPISAVAAELKGLAEPYGYIVTDLAPSGTGTSRTASARIVRTR